MTQPDWATILAGYGRALHAAVGDGHHVVSPLGAWLVVALCGGLAGSDRVASAELAEALRCDPADAAAFAGRLLSEPHALVPTGAGVWVRGDRETERVASWRAGLPATVDTGDIPTQDGLDRWAEERTLGLIRRFPLRVTPDVVGLLASAVATKVSWEAPFDVVDASELGPSRWGSAVRSVLESPTDPRHRQFLADTPDAGPVAVHLAAARGGLLVGSVIAADATVPAGRVLAAAGAIVTAEARQPGSTEGLSLHDLPLGAGPVWEIREDPDGPAPLHGGPRFTTILPAWSARTDVDLKPVAALGFGVAAAAIARALDLADWRCEARQNAVAEYSAVGFEAAAVTGLAISFSAQLRPPGTPRRAVVRFRHPYAVVAATGNDPRRPSPPLWRGLPVFSVWVAEAVDAGR